MNPLLLSESLLLGAMIGLIIGLTGAGGSIIAVPLLMSVLGLTMLEAAPIGLLAAGLASALGAYLAWRSHILRYRAALLVAVTGLLLVPAGVWLAHRLPHTPLVYAFAAVLTFSALRTLLGKPDDDAQREHAPCVTHPQHGRLLWTFPCARALALTGVISGLLSGLLGVGGGFVIVPALRRFSTLAMDSIVATSMGIVALLSIGGVASATLAGSMRWDIAAPFAAAAMLGVMLARRWAARLGGPRLQQLFALLCLLVAVLMIVRELS